MPWCEPVVHTQRLRQEGCLNLGTWVLSEQLVRLPTLKSLKVIETTHQVKSSDSMPAHLLTFMPTYYMIGGVNRAK